LRSPPTAHRIRLRVVARRRNACRLAPPQDGGARSAVQLLAALAAMFASLPPSSSYLAERKSVVPPLLLQIGGANIENPPLSSSLGEGTTPLLALPPCGGARFPTLAVRFCALLAHRAMFDCSLRSLRIAPGSRLLCRCSPTKCVSARSSGGRGGAG